ncbi:hypothetical protein SLA2020_444100 [Shorea laevis]
MSLLSWNCRGLGKPRIIRDLCQLVEEKKPRFLFLMETKIRQNRMQIIRNKIGFASLLAIDPVGLSGGVAFLWKDAREVDIHNFSRRHISAIITLMPLGDLWKFTGFYGHPARAHREESWRLLAHLKIFNPTPWLCVGDFNEIVTHSEKKGDSLHSVQHMEAFSSTLEECGLNDLGFCGPKYTWTNCREGGNFMKERLDRTTANREWCSKFHVVVVTICWELGQQCIRAHIPLVGPSLQVQGPCLYSTDPRGTRVGCYDKGRNSPSSVL